MGDNDKAMLVRLSERDHAQLVRLAAAQDRTMAAVVRVLIRQAAAGMADATAGEVDDGS